MAAVKPVRAHPTGSSRKTPFRATHITANIPRQVPKNSAKSATLALQRFHCYFAQMQKYLLICCSLVAMLLRA